jgi:transitional endoplasmic reticulum ATPase
LEVIYPQSQSALYHAYHRTPGTGILLYGPPGCGKTLLAKAVAHECGNEMTFYAPPIAEILSRWVGQSEKRVTQLFAALAQTRPAILFLDELDALLPRSGPSYMRRIKNTFLQCMDGITSTMDQLLIMGATNRPWLIDPAVRRPGRFSHQILIPPPDLQARQAIFNLNLAPLRNNALVAADVDVLELALLTSGYSGADITAICHDACDIPLHEALQGHGQRPLTQQDFATALTRRQPSILPWMIEATRAIKRYQEHRCFPDILKLATDLQDATKP